MLLTAGMLRLNAPMAGLSVLVLLTDQPMTSRLTRYVSYIFLFQDIFPNKVLFWLKIDVILLVSHVAVSFSPLCTLTQNYIN